MVLEADAAVIGALKVRRLQLTNYEWALCALKLEKKMKGSVERMKTLYTEVCPLDAYSMFQAATATAYTYRHHSGQDPGI